MSAKVAPKPKEDVCGSVDLVKTEAQTYTTIDIGTNTNVSTKPNDEYKEFFKKRKTKKINLYKNVALTGIVLAIVGGFVVVSAFNEGFYSLYWYCSVIPGSFIRVAGICILSVVPTEDFDIFFLLVDDRNWKWLYSLTIILSILVTGGAIYLLGFGEPYNVYLCIAWSVWFMFNIVPPFVKEKLSYAVLSIKTCCFILGYTILISWEDFYYGDTIDLVYAVINTLSVVCVAFRIYYGYAIESKTKKGWGAHTLYHIAYIVFPVFLTIGFVVNGIINIFILPTPVEIIGPFLGAFVDLLPILVAGYLGFNRSFTLVARYFELNTDRLQEEGAFLASIVAKTDVNEYIMSDIQQAKWIYRANPNGEFQYPYVQFPRPGNSIKRECWMLGKLSITTSSDGSIVTSVTVNYEMDTYLTWYATYDDNLKLIRGHYEDTVVRKWERPQALSFNAWVTKNFGSLANNSIIIDDEKKSVVVHTVKEIKTEVISKEQLVKEIKAKDISKEQLLEWAKTNLKYFDTAKFTDDLFKKSPREVSTDEEKEELFSRSCVVYSSNSSSDTVLRNGKIDYFISHSWTDDPNDKCTKFQKFIDDFKGKHKRKPTVWLDKVCINQKDVGPALEVLPINIGACEKFLLLMSPSYIQRLWCVWELFTLFTFTNFELAMDRIEFVFLGDLDEKKTIDLLSKFEIKDAHCFDPNEEFKLRHIIKDMDGERLVADIKKFTEELKKRLADAEKAKANPIMRCCGI